MKRAYWFLFLLCWGSLSRDLLWDDEAMELCWQSMTELDAGIEGPATYALRRKLRAGR